MKIDLKNILESLTVEQAQAWKETSEKFLFIDYDVLSAHNISLNSLNEVRMNWLLDAIEDAFDIILENSK